MKRFSLVEIEDLLDYAAIDPTAYLGAILMELTINKRPDEAFAIYQRITDKRRNFLFPLEVYERLLKKFFQDQQWRKFIPGLKPVTQARILAEVGYILQAQGKMTWALRIKRASVEMLVEASLVLEGAQAGARLSECYLYHGNEPMAIATARTAVELADSITSAIDEQIFARIKLANALYEFTGPDGMAPRIYHQATALGVFSDFSRYLYAEFLAASSESEEAVRQLLPLTCDARKHTQGLAKILLGMLWQNVTHVEAGLIILRESGVKDELPRGLIWAARYYRSTGDLETARQLITEATLASKTMSLRLFQRKSEAELADMA